LSTNVRVIDSLCPQGPWTPWCQRFRKNGRSRFALLKRIASSVRRSVIDSPGGPSLYVWKLRNPYGEK
jgi:hypothetical protein